MQTNLVRIILLSQDIPSLLRYRQNICRVLPQNCALQATIATSPQASSPLTTPNLQSSSSAPAPAPSASPAANPPSRPSSNPSSINSFTAKPPPPSTAA